MSEMIRVLLVEDQQLIQGALKNFLQRDGAIEVVAEADGGTQAIDLALQHKPDVLVIDVALPDMGGIDAVNRIQKLLPDTGIVIVSAIAVDIVHRALRSLRENGVRGFITKNSAIDELLLAIYAVRSKKEYLSKDIVHYLMSPERRDEISVILDELPDRELQVLLLTTQGKCNKEIAILMILSPKTVSTYKKRVYKRLSIENDVQLIHWALHHNLIKLQYPWISTTDE
ncbi:MAG TPA: hypothetical protein DDW45_09280 [Gammaproteobacteria bacterium]|nr:hypothetical protein [Gammaproteobacteria bacterium]